MTGFVAELVGVNVTLYVHDEVAGIVLPQAFVPPGAAANPAVALTLMGMAAAPVFVIVNVSGELVVVTSVPGKAASVEMVNVGIAVPVPLRATVMLSAGLPRAVKAIVVDEDSAVVVDGVNVTAYVQLAPAAKDVPHAGALPSAAAVTVKSVLVGGVSENVIELVVLFVSVMYCAVEVVEMIWVPKLTLSGVT